MPVTATAALQALLNSGVQLAIADCYEVTLQDGTLIRWTDAEVPVSATGAFTLPLFSLGPLIQRTRIKNSVGVSVDDLTLTLTDDGSTSVGTLTLLQALAAGRFDGARVRLLRVYGANWSSGWVGAIERFNGTVATVTLTRDGAEIVVRHDLQLLNTKFPMRSYQPGCGWTLGDSHCGASIPNSSGQVTAVTYRWQFNTNLDGSVIAAAAITRSRVWQSGRLTFTSGNLAGQTFPVKAWSGVTCTLLRAPIASVQVGDTFTLIWACDKTRDVCAGVYGRLSFYGGYPFIPAAETAIPA